MLVWHGKNIKNNKTNPFPGNRKEAMLFQRKIRSFSAAKRCESTIDFAFPVCVGWPGHLSGFQKRLAHTKEVTIAMWRRKTSKITKRTHFPRNRKEAMLVNEISRFFGRETM